MSYFYFSLREPNFALLISLYKTQNGRLVTCVFLVSTRKNAA